MIADTIAKDIKQRSFLTMSNLVVYIPGEWDAKDLATRLEDIAKELRSEGWAALIDEPVQTNYVIPKSYPKEAGE